MGINSVYDDYKSRINEEDEEQSVHNIQNLIKCKSNQSSRKSMKSSKRPDSAAHEDLINELDELIDL